MDATEPQEPSYYEVALTNRQVLVAFVALLTCLLVAFLAGVWIGRGGAVTEAENAPRTAPGKAAEPPLEQLSFFNGTDPGAGTGPSEAATRPEPAAAKPEPAPPAPAAPPAAAGSDASEAMRQNLEATMAANRETPAMKMAVGERAGQAPGAAPAPPAGSTAPQPAKPAVSGTARPAAPAAKPAAAIGKLFVQVYSSGNGERARELVADLRRAGFAVVMAETAKAGGRNYRVRVGPFADRAAADAAAIRLRRDHRLDTWVTDSP